ncbi:PREDICTED: probable serine/threonine-protein kinase nek3 isoform X2 [Amphimedon queenslandica]|uniref:Uncharacterized protein n=1 Tax=Amphimedon queenslandica TaxID=400682 RepID=A0A1X7UV70_AMPQE|nr:PREDICTED: probable serine/threonine-protein kinase nek3 isoform X2 [Amphimedon queenslandica]|eukprot:XP_019852078.1 PREDICTED: probable serine/threonine-protein kinase nek3 isoform X2 [Amphimedon queenslandica]
MDGKDSKKEQVDDKGTFQESAGNNSSSTNPANLVPQVTPTRLISGRTGKRKLQSVTPPHEHDKSGSSKRRRSTSSLLMSPPTSTFKPLLTERQQLALLKQMNDVNTSPGEASSVGSHSVESSPRDTPTKSRVHKRNERGETLLHLACIRGDRSSVVSLLEQGADPNSTDYAGWTPLHEACNHGHVDIVSILLDNDVLINAPGMGGDTPLHDAVMNSHLKVVQLLLDKGANASIPNTHNKTPLDLCTDEHVRNLLIKFLDNAPPTTPSNVNGNKRDDKLPHPLFVSQTPPSHNISRRRPRRQGNSFVMTPPTSQVTKKKSSSESVHDNQSPGNKEAGGAVRSHPLKPVQLKLETNGESFENNENNTSDDNNNNDNIDGVLITESTTGSQSNACTDSVIHVSTNDQSTTESTVDQSTTEQPTVVQSTIEQPPIVQSTIDQSTNNQSTIDQSTTNQSTINRPSIDQSQSVSITMPVIVHDNNNTDDGDDNTEDDVFQVEAPAKLGPEERSPEGLSSPMDTVESMDVSLSVLQSGVGGSNATVDRSFNSLEDQSTVDQPESQTQSPKNGSQSPVTGSQSPTDASQSPKESFSDESKFPVDATGCKDQAVSSLIVNISIDKVHLLTSTDSNRTCPLSPSDAGSGNIDTDVCSLSITSGGVSNVKDIDDPNQGDDLKKGGASSDDKAVQDTMTLLPDDEDSMSTVVSFSTSLPLVFSSRASSRSQSPAPSLSPMATDHTPLTATPTPSTLLINSLKSGLPLRRGRSEEPPSSNYKSAHFSDGRHQLKSPPSIAVASSSMVKSPPPVAESERSVDDKSTKKESNQVLPVKKRIMNKVYKSRIIQQRKEYAANPPPFPAPPFNFNTFMITNKQYQINTTLKEQQQSDPKSVYPPLSSCCVDLFVEQDMERIKLLTSHLTEVDHLLISFEQEILRANDKIRNPTLLSNHSLCSVLIERLLPQTNTDDQSNSPAAPSDFKGGLVDATKDERLLTGYVQDVWDRFHKEALLIAERQKLEVETLWTLQTNQWKQRIEKCTGEVLSVSEIPASHVPFTHTRIISNYKPHAC